MLQGFLKLIKNKSSVSGVLHRERSEEHYNLRRYLPDKPLSELVEQFWFVNWNLDEGVSHTQRNLPDPNFNMIYENKKLKVIGPVSKTYSYEMRRAGEILGVKFEIGALSSFLVHPIHTYIDRTLDACSVFGLAIDEICPLLEESDNDGSFIEILSEAILPFLKNSNENLVKLRYIIKLIKNEKGIYRVEQLSERVGLSIRTLQRMFHSHVGFSPKRLIRKYRLHHLLKEFEEERVEIAEVAALLDYTDQSHLIKDFSELIGMTPMRYKQSHYDGKFTK